MLLIETRRPPPDRGDSGRPVWEPNWRLWGWVAASIVFGVAADSLSGLVAYALVLVTTVCVCRAVLAALPPMDGLRQHRQ
jgi:hypothetical protein